VREKRVAGMRRTLCGLLDLVRREGSASGRPKAWGVSPCLVQNLVVKKKREPDGRQGDRSSMDNTGGDDGSSL
jgi:hypothetical protein